jgi:hypothetical protein
MELSRIRQSFVGSSRCTQAHRRLQAHYGPCRCAALPIRDHRECSVYRGRRSGTTEHVVSLTPIRGRSCLGDSEHLCRCIESFRQSARLTLYPHTVLRLPRRSPGRHVHSSRLSEAQPCRMVDDWASHCGKSTNESAYKERNSRNRVPSNASDTGRQQLVL